ncbi:DNA-binding protein [Aliirhizobium smilacinae]|uniref:DNA-binding protein n=1 Tax=Aliirhizobium smilacinae TaxID=1395944 RepID=A0A5C4XU13_9HYPH|nr:DNA-binding protein [Rhizobium smilacinae]
MSRTTVWRRIKDGTLPPPIEIGGLRRWPKSEILACIERAKSARPAAA